MEKINDLLDEAYVNIMLVKKDYIKTGACNMVDLLAGMSNTGILLGEAFYRIKQDKLTKDKQLAKKFEKVHNYFTDALVDIPNMCKCSSFAASADEIKKQASEIRDWEKQVRAKKAKLGDNWWKSEMYEDTVKELEQL